MSWIMEDDNKNMKKKEFEALFKEYFDVVYRLSIYKTGDESVAKNIAQECFLRLWKSILNGKNIKKPKSYIYQIARNLIVDHYKENRSLSLDQFKEEGFDAESSDSSPELKTEISILKEVIDSLEEDFREVIYMRLVEGMRVKDIADMLNISENLVSVRINRGKKKIKDHFK